MAYQSVHVCRISQVIKDNTLPYNPARFPHQQSEYFPLVPKAGSSDRRAHELSLALSAQNSPLALTLTLERASAPISDRMLRSPSSRG